MATDRFVPAFGSQAYLSTAMHRDSVRPSHSRIIWFLLLAMFVPATMKMAIGGLDFYPGRIPITIFVFPAIYTLVRDVSRERRRLLTTDVLMILLSAWMMLATLMSAGPTAIVSTGSYVLDLFGSYAVARAYIYRTPALRTFIRALKVVLAIVVAFAFAETLSGRYLMSNIDPTRPDYIRYGLLRATSTFKHPILFGSFCASSGALMAYSENRQFWIFWVSIALFGTFLSLSSAPILAALLFVFAYCYDYTMSQFYWRWRVMWVVIFTLTAVAFVISNNPISWILSHMLFNPVDGYFRINTWNAGLAQLTLSPIFGFSFEKFTDEYLISVDTVWLLISMRFGYPAAILLLLANLSTFLRITRTKKSPRESVYLDHLRTGFTAVLVVYIIVGVTVDFYDSMWMFWGLCIGVRASLQEDFVSGARRAYISRNVSGRIK